VLVETVENLGDVRRLVVGRHDDQGAHETQTLVLDRCTDRLIVRRR
jgi:hypothetical protein